MHCEIMGSRKHWRTPIIARSGESFLELSIVSSFGNCVLHLEISTASSINFLKKEDDGATLFFKSCLNYIYVLTGYQLRLNMTGLFITWI
jgi:hypothetical protein